MQELAEPNGSANTSIEAEILTEMPIRFPTSLPRTPEVERLLAEWGVSDRRYQLDYLLGVYAFVDSCTGRRIRHGAVGYFLHWENAEDGIGRSAGFSLSEQYPPEDLSEDDVHLFSFCVETYISSHDVELPNLSVTGPMVWGDYVRFPLEDRPVVKLALEYANSFADAP